MDIKIRMMIIIFRLIKKLSFLKLPQHHQFILLIRFGNSLIGRNKR